MLTSLVLMGIYGRVSFTLIQEVKGDENQGLWLDGWNSRTTITVDHSAFTTDWYELKITITWNSRYNNDFSDIRLRDPEELITFDWWVEEIVERDHIDLWVEIPGDATQKDCIIFLFYQNEYANDWGLVPGNVSAASVFHHVISSGVTLALPMDEGSGATLIDYSGNGNNATITGATWITTGRFGTGLSFDGANDVAYAGPVTLTDTLSTFVYFNGPAQTNGEYPNVIGQSNNAVDNAQWALNVRSDSGATWGIVGAEAPAADGLYDSNNNTVALTYNSAGNTIIYFNGSASDTHASAVNAASNRNVEIMRFEVRSTEYCQGILSGVFVFSTELSSTIITNLNEHYPQCSASNPGVLYLRNWVDGGVTYVTSTDRIENMEWIYTFGLIAVWIITVALFKFGFPLLNIVFGVVSIGLVAGTISNDAVIFAPYLQIGVLLTAVVLMLASVERGIRH